MNFLDRPITDLDLGRASYDRLKRDGVLRIRDLGAWVRESAWAAAQPGELAHILVRLNALRGGKVESNEANPGLG